MSREPYQTWWPQKPQPEHDGFPVGAVVQVRKIKGGWMNYLAVITGPLDRLSIWDYDPVTLENLDTSTDQWAHEVHKLNPDGSVSEDVAACTITRMRPATPEVLEHFYSM